MNKDRFNSYIKGDYDPRYPFDFGFVHILFGLVIIALIFLALYGIDYLASLPDVKFSHSTGKCVEVINYTDEQFTCDNLPSKFYHQWTE